MADAGDLEKLPPEIRRQIYTHLLVEPITIAIKHYISPNAYKSGEVTRMDHHRKVFRARKVLDRCRKAWVGAPPSTTSILLANKSIFHEATPVLYGDNHFFLDSAGILQDFLAWIGQSRQHLRHVEVDGRGIMHNETWKAMDRSLRLLESSHSLRALHFYHNGFCRIFWRNSVDIRQMGKRCTPLLRSLQASCEARNLKIDVLEIVKIVLPPCHCEFCTKAAKCYYLPCRVRATHSGYHPRVTILPGGGAYGETSTLCNCFCHDAEDNNRLLDGKLKDEIAKQLGLSTGHEEA